MHEPVRSLTITSTRSISAWSGHAEVTGPGCRPGRARVLTGLAAATDGAIGMSSAADAANGEGDW